MRPARHELAQRLDSLLHGEREALEWLARHPELKREMEELKALLGSLPVLAPDVGPSPEWRRKTKEQLLARFRRRRRRRGA